GKALGLLWMNMGSLKYTGVPSVFFISSQKRVEDMAGAGEGDDLSVNRIGFEGLKKSITVESEKPDTQRYVDELFKLKSQDGLYQEQTGNVTYDSADQGFKAFHITIAMPSRLAPGQYSVHVYSVKDGKITSDAEKPIEAKLVGIPAFLANMAFNHSLLYGVLATLIAVIGGLIIGFVFQGAKEGSH
ncbi:MAG: TIGR02186 family protein, partial [Desulfobacteraceae bacterium]